MQMSKLQHLHLQQMRESSDSEQYQIKELLKYRIRNGVQQLLICWDGYSITQSTWQPYRNINPFPGLSQDYQKLKSQYENKKKPRLASKIIQQSKSQALSEQESSKKQSPKQQFVISKKRSKKISKAIRAKKTPHLMLQSQDNGPQEQLALRLQSQNSKPLVRQQSLDEILNRTPATKFVIKIPVCKDIPCLGQKLKHINKCFKHQGIVFYEIEVDNQNFLQPVILSQSYIRVLWPRQFAQYLLEKTRFQ